MKRLKKVVTSLDEESPNTGDPMAPYLWSTLMLVGATTLVGVSKTNKRRK